MMPKVDALCARAILLHVSPVLTVYFRSQAEGWGGPDVGVGDVFVPDEVAVVAVAVVGAVSEGYTDTVKVYPVALQLFTSRTKDNARSSSYPMGELYCTRSTPKMQSLHGSGSADLFLKAARVSSQ